MNPIEKLQYQDDFISRNNIEKNIGVIYGKALPILEHRKELYERYTRKNSDKSLDVPLEYYISTIASGYFGGKEPQYIVKKVNESQKNILQKVFKRVFNNKNDPDDFQAIIDNITKYNDNGSFFYDCVKDYINLEACYGLLYQSEDKEIIYSHISSLNAVAIWNYNVPCEKIGLLRCWNENGENGGIERHAQIITKNYKEEFVDGEKKSTTNSNEKYDFKKKNGSLEEVEWTDLPIFAVENPDGLGFWENAIKLIDKYEQVITNNANIFKYNDEAKLKITGFSPENDLLIPVKNENGETLTDENGNTLMTQNPARKKEDEAILKSKIFYVPDNSGNVEWIIKDINDTASENHKKTCLDMALMITGVPNVTDQGFTNADNAAALEKKFFPLEQVLQQADDLFRKELLRMWEMITQRINLLMHTTYDFRDIDVRLKRNLPQDTETVVNEWLKLRGLLSDKTIISHLPFELDAEAELAEVDTQNEENIKKNLEQMSITDSKSNENKKQVEDDKDEQKNNIAKDTQIKNQR